jgi:hypothetical protein
MKILYLTSSEEDYLSDSLLIGLKQLFGADCVDYPERDVLYVGCNPVSRARVRGNGFTLYTSPLGAENQTDRFHIRPRLESGCFDLVIVSDIWRQFGLFAQWRTYLRPENTIILDGQDTPQVYPSAGIWWRRPYYWGLPRVTSGFLYFKREWTEASHFNLWHRALPLPLRRGLPAYKGLRKIAFSIPDEKIVASVPEKEKLFGTHIVDTEVAGQVPGARVSYAFTSETEYYDDLRRSRFGITTKRAGWDCLRHYEIAANGCVPCFRSLASKPATCAPHGLIDGVNCVDYASYNELARKISLIDETRYRALAEGAIRWARENSCRNAAEGVLSAWREAFPQKATG